jgi:signal transduction histidine kinase
MNPDIALFQTLIDANPSLSFALADSEGMLAIASGEWKRERGGDACRDKPFWMLPGGEVDWRLKECFEEALATGRIVNFVRERGGRLFRVSLNPIEISGCAYVAESDIDVTAENQARDSLERRISLFKDLDRGAKAGMVIFERYDGLCLVSSINQAATTLLGCEGQVVGRGIAESAKAIGKGAGSRIAEGLARAFEQGMAEDFEIRIESSGVWCMASINPLRGLDGGVERVVLTLFDVSRLKRAEADLSAALSSAERSIRDLERFASIISHDLQEPARSLYSLLTLFLDRYRAELRPESVEFIERSVGAAERMVVMIKRLLDFSRVSIAGDAMVECDLQAVLTMALSDLHAAIEQSGAAISIEQALPKVQGDALQIHRVFINVISNAIKYAKAGAKPSIRVSWERLPDSIELSFEDGGIGIAEAERERIFDFAVRLKAAASLPGQGIGLSIAKRIMERHGGDIRAEAPSSMEDGGARFVLRFPLHPLTASA